MFSVDWLNIELIDAHLADYIHVTQVLLGRVKPVKKRFWCIGNKFSTITQCMSHPITVLTMINMIWILKLGTTFCKRYPNFTYKEHSHRWVIHRYSWNFSF